jgi:hypothetical protein
MFKNKKWIAVLLGGTLIAAIAMGAVAYVGIQTTNAQAAITRQRDFRLAAAPLVGSDLDGFGHRGWGPPRGDGQDLTILADALGITVEELEAAMEEVRIAAIENAVVEGQITQEQADKILEGDLGARGMPFLGRPGMKGPQSGADHDALLAGALGISVEELQTAREGARIAGVDQAIADGRITQEQADLMQAFTAIRDYIDRESLMAEVLGVSVEELQTAHEERLPISNLLEVLGLSAEDVHTAMKTAFEAAVQEALEDGVITQEQADLILNSDFAGRGFSGFKDMDGFRGHGGRGGFPGFSCPDAPPSNTQNNDA